LRNSRQGLGRCVAKCVVKCVVKCVNKHVAKLAKTGAARAKHGVIGALILACLAAPPAYPAQGLTLLPAADLRAEASEAARHGEPLLILYSRQNCPYCDEVRKIWLLPLGRDAKQSGLAIRQIDQDSDRPLIDFAGNPSTHARFAASRKITLVPVVAAYGPRGQRLADDIVGLRLRDFYGAYLDAQLDGARSRLRKQ